jgi:hypothetical protein
MKVIVTLLHHDFKQLYKIAFHESGNNEAMQVLLNKGIYFFSKSFANTVHILWDETWKEGGEGELLFEEFAGDIPYHVVRYGNGNDAVSEDFNRITPSAPEAGQDGFPAAEEFRSRRAFSASEMYEAPLR